MSSLLVHCHGENWKSPTRSFGRSGKAKRTFQGTKRTFSLSQMNNVELARTLSWRELEIANTELWAKWKGKTHFSRNENVGCCFDQRVQLRLRVKVGVVMLPALTLNRCAACPPPSCLVVRGFNALIV